MKNTLSRQKTEKETSIATKDNRKESLVDTLGVVSYSLIVGAVTDYSAGLRGIGVLASRLYGTAINLPTGAPYGKWRNFIYKKTKTTNESSKLRKSLVELAAFNTFQVPLYVTVIGVGSLVSNLISSEEFKIDFDKVIKGAEHLAIISPLIGPTLGLYTEGLRKLFGLKSVPRKARESLEEELQ
ncbi:L-alanine exporter AlaE [Candidatus Pacearchaeota archaeon]|nr:L-alanine exporter AlaE [Candidatus Pacearchaeota archaeon]